MLPQAQRGAEGIQPPAGLPKGLRPVGPPVRDREGHQLRERIVEDHAPQQAPLRAGKSVHVRAARFRG
jgi:hypothetical protein